MDYEQLAILPNYKAGEPIPATLCGEVKINIFALRRYLEFYRLNEWDLILYRFGNHAYAIGIDLRSTKYDTLDEVMGELSKRFKIKNTLESVAEKLYEILNNYIY